MKGRISANLEKILRSPKGSAQLRRVLTNQTDPDQPVQVDEIKFFIRKVGSMSPVTSNSPSSVEMK
jgi:hypothetical protein